MADQFTYTKLPSDPCLTQEQITAYIDGKLSAADQHACEMHIADCAMCDDALEGLALVKDRSVLALPLIKESSAPTGSKIIPLHEPNRKKMWYAVAAILVLVLGSTIVVKLMDSSGPDSFADNEARNVSADSIGAPSDRYSLLESGKKTDTGNYQVTISDADGTGDLRRETEPAAQKAFGPTEYAERDDYRNSPDEAVRPEGTKSETEKTPVLKDNVEEQEVLVLNEGVNDAETNKKSEVVKEEDKKTNFWNRTSFDLPSGNSGNRKSKADNAGTVEQQTLVNTGIAVDPGAGAADEDETKSKDANAQSEAPEVTAGVPAAPQSVVTQSPVPAYDRYTDSGVVYAGTVTASDTTALAVDQLEISYINGINLLAAGQANAAITMFDKVMLDKNHPRYEDAEFQKAKALIKANRKEEAKTLLKAIETKKGKHATEATDLLKTL